MEIREVDVDDDAQMHAAFSVWGPALRFGREDQPPWREPEFLGSFRSPDEAEVHELHLAVDDDGEPAGALALYVPVLDNLDKAYADVVVHPGHRGRGVGDALVSLLEERTRAHGRRLLIGSTKVPHDAGETHPHRAFAARHGFGTANLEVVRHQALPVAVADLDTWAAHAGERAAGYALSTHVDGFPDDLAPSLCVLLGQLAVDAPTGAVDFEEEVFTPERLRQRHELTRAMGRQSFETVAVLDGVVVAQSTLSVPLTGSDAFQWGTFVHREHRGHRLGLAVKVANLRAVQAAHPHIARVTTQNAETNRWMIAVNELMGFHVAEDAVELVKDLG